MAEASSLGEALRAIPSVAQARKLGAHAGGGGMLAASGELHSVEHSVSSDSSSFFSDFKLLAAEDEDNARRLIQAALDERKRISRQAIDSRRRFYRRALSGAAEVAAEFSPSPSPSPSPTPSPSPPPSSSPIASFSHVVSSIVTSPVAATDADIKRSNESTRQLAVAAWGSAVEETAGSGRVDDAAVSAGVGDTERPHAAGLPPPSASGDGAHHVASFFYDSSKLVCVRCVRVVHMLHS